MLTLQDGECTHGSACCSGCANEAGSLRRRGAHRRSGGRASWRPRGSPQRRQRRPPRLRASAPPTRRPKRASQGLSLGYPNPKTREMGCGRARRRRAGRDVLPGAALARGGGGAPPRMSRVVVYLAPCGWGPALPGAAATLRLAGTPACSAARAGCYRKVTKLIFQVSGVFWLMKGPLAGPCMCG